MIEVLGPVDSREHEAAQSLRDIIAEEWTDAESKNVRIKIVAEAQCYGQEVRDIDLLLAAEVNGKHSIASPQRDRQRAYLRNLCLTIEVKGHSSQNVRFRGNQVEVRYNNKWHDASDQSEKQQRSVRGYLERNSALGKPPYVVNLVWLRNVPKQELPSGEHNILGSNSTWKDFVRCVAIAQRPFKNDKTDRYEITALSARNFAERVASPFSERMQPSKLDRTKMERVTEKVLSGQQYEEKLGDQLLIFRGRGGTGKTVRLLRLAHDLYQRGERVLILTYNLALVADIKRLLALMGISDEVANKAIEIRTVHSFLYRLLDQDGLGVLPRGCSDFLEDGRYEHYKSQALELVSGIPADEVMSLASNEMSLASNETKKAFTWDYILVDESQDWPADERDILFSLYDYSQFVLADGIDQLVRSSEPINWRENIDNERTQVVRLRKVLRLKRNLYIFLKSFAEHVGIDRSRIEPHSEATGGRVIIVEGEYEKEKSIHEEILRLNGEDGNQPVDMLFCTPPSLVDRSNGRRSIIGQELKAWGHKIWDGTSEDIRKSHPTDLEQLRIVQYDSCRGLEGWAVVNLRFEDFFDYKKETYEPTSEEQQDMFFDKEKKAKRHALNWLMIPLTRAMDTLLIQVASSDHFITNVLRDIADEHEDIVEWQTVE